MRLLDFLGKERVVPELRATDKAGVLDELVQVLVADGVVSDRDAVVRVLLEREKLGSTGIGDGIAIPHGKLGGLGHVVAAFGRSLEGVPFESLDGAPVHLFFLLLSPAESASTHLIALARVSRLMKNPAFREELLKTETQQAIFDAIAAEDARG